MPELFALPGWLLFFMAAWFFFVGGCIGSFMNVMIYRLPLGRSIVSPPSSCPKCKSAIRWHDNLPVIGWLMLRGKCRDCGAPISARYPLVETLVGTIFLLLAAELMLPGGPRWPTSLTVTEMAANWRQPAAAAGMYAVLLCTLICAAYIAWDGERSPWRMFLPAILTGAVVPLLIMQARPLAPESGDSFAGALVALRDGGLGALLGGALGAAWDRIGRRGEMALALGTSGWVLGLAGTAFVVTLGIVVAYVWSAVVRSAAGRRSASLGGIFIAALAWALAGKIVIAAIFI
jgi:leader peptidase (prepilin peptidase)/N-methyltransferase